MAFKSRPISIADLRRVRRANDRIVRHAAKIASSPGRALQATGNRQLQRSRLGGLAGEIAGAFDAEGVKKLLLKESGLAELQRYARLGGLSRVLGLFGPLGGLVGDLLESLGRTRETFSTQDVQAAARILQAAGYDVLKQGTARPKPIEAPELRPQHQPGRQQPPPTPPPPQGIATPPQPQQPLPVGGLPGQQAIQMRHVTGSSNVYAYGYNAETLTLRVQFLGNAVNVHALNRTEDLRSGKGHKGKNRVRGKLGQTVTNSRRGAGPVYDYRGVPERVFRRFDSAASKGNAVWDLLRIRGTIFGHQYDYALVAASVVDVVQPIRQAGRMLAGATVGKLTYVPRKATATGFKSRSIRQGTQTFKSALPTQRLGGRA